MFQKDRVEHSPSSGVLCAGRGLVPRLLVHLLLVAGGRVVAGGGVVGHLVRRPHVVHRPQLLGQCRQILEGVEKVSHQTRATRVPNGLDGIRLNSSAFRVSQAAAREHHKTMSALARPHF